MPNVSVDVVVPTSSWNDEPVAVRWKTPRSVLPSPFQSPETGVSGQLVEVCVVFILNVVRWKYDGTSVPLSRSSKCRCGPVTLPVSPTNPTGWLWSMVMPSTSQVSFMWAYSVERPAPWSMIA